MKLLFVPVLVAVLGQAGDDPTVRMKAMEEKIAKADSLQVTLNCKFESKKGDGSFKGSLTVGAGNKSRAEFSIDFLGKEMKLQVVSDGTKMATTQDGKPQDVKDTPKKLRSSMTVLLARSGFVALFFFLQGGPAAEKEDPLKIVKVSDFKKLKVEKIGDRDALVIEYKLTFDDKFASKGTVWLDLKTNLPLKRVIQAEVMGENFTITETYSDFRINPKLKANLFELPK